MRAFVWNGKKDIRCETVTDPEIEQPRDTIVKVTSEGAAASHTIIATRWR